MFYQGIVENNVDPLKLGRCQVRIFGLHTDIIEDYPTNDLPWADAAFPISSSNVSGISDFMVPQNGSNVWLFFKDPEKQFPVYFATSPKIEKTPDFTKGFSDPNGVYPTSENNDESGISRLARNENITETIIQTKKDSVITGIDCGNGVTFDEPTTTYDPVYPKNRVIETEHHIIELDDTLNNERIHIYHKSGSSVEYHPNGDLVDRVNNNRFTITLGDDDVLIKGNQNIRIEGNQNVKIVGSENIEVEGDTKLDCLGNVKLLADNVIELDGGSGGQTGIVTGDCICAFTGKEHIQRSADAKATKG